MLWFFVYLLSFVVMCNADHFRGGTISWKPTGNANEAEFTYRIGWRYSAGPGCTQASIGQYLSFNSMAWVCTSGCNPDGKKISDAGYICKAASKSQNWELGEYSFKYTFSSKGPFELQYSGGNWIDLSVGSPEDWSMITTVDLHTRSDTLLPNNSPEVLGKPMYTVKYGCTGVIKLPVVDIEGDNIRCRWATGSDECATVCKNIRNTLLDEENCVLTVNANHKKDGMYAVALMVEDYAQSTITVNGKKYTTNDVISSVPIQFLVNTPDIPSRRCSDKPVFVYPTPPESEILVLKPGETLYVGFYATSPGTIIESFLPIGPTGLAQSSIRMLTLRSEVYSVDVTWKPTAADSGLKTLCSEATDTYSINSDLHCVTIAAWDIDPCTTIPCLNNGTCSRVGHTTDHKCSCLPGYTGDNCQIDINECASNPCMNGATCFDLVNEYFCGCVDGYTDKNCQTDINECDFQVCENGGTCIDTVGAAVCDCEPGFTGAVCQTGIDYCASQPCQNDAVCVYNETTGYKCECKDGWWGTYCAYRHENETFISNFSMIMDYMHYSSCECYFGNGKQELCYNYDKPRGTWFGVLGAIFGLLTSVLFYVINECCFRKIVPAQFKDTEEESFPDTKDKIENIDDDTETKYDEDECDSSRKSNTNAAPRYHHCWACDVKYNKVEPPRFWPPYQKR